MIGKKVWMVVYDSKILTHLELSTWRGRKACETTST